MLRSSRNYLPALIAACLAFSILVVARPAGAQGIDATQLSGIVVDDAAAELEGSWTKSTHTRPFINEGYIHDANEQKGKKSARFSLTIPSDGSYQVLLAYTPGTNRDRNVPIDIHTADGLQTVYVDQSKPPALPTTFHPLGMFPFKKDAGAVIVVSNRETRMHVIADAVQLLTAEEFKVVQESAKKNPAPKLVAKKPPAKKQQTAKKTAPPQPAAPTFEKLPPSRPVAQITTGLLDEMLEQAVDGMASAEPASDEEFLVRASLDLLGRPPTRDELLAFAADDSPEKRAAAIDRMLASSEYGTNWANYWSDVIGHRQQEPELTFHNYKPFKAWLADRLNSGTTWDEIVFLMLTARGKVGDNPAATFVGFHQGDANRLAGETSRVFLGIKIACAECHDHPFVDMPQETFHGMAAFFARTEAKIAQLDSNGIEVKSKTKGEQKIPGRKDEMPPTLLDGDSLELGIEDLARRAALGQWITSGDNPFYARAYVNRIWARLMGAGFVDPIDDMGEDAAVVLPKIHAALADHFVATGFDHRELLRLIMNSRAYQRALTPPVNADQPVLAAPSTKLLRGDEVFDSLVAAIGLDNVTPPRAAKTGAVRFPPPPKSTRDLVNAAFGYDPSFPDSAILRTMKQAMFLMNNSQLQEAISAANRTESFLAKLLADNDDDQEAATALYEHVLARRPTEKEMAIVQGHIKNSEDRSAAYEDILWSLINSAEFTLRR